MLMFELKPIAAQSTMYYNTTHTQAKLGQIRRGAKSLPHTMRKYFDVKAEMR
jgi:hypothetical protein